MSSRVSPLLVVAVALLRAEGQVLMQQRPPGKAHAGLWEFPGGKLEAGESAEIAACREIAEELGVVLRPADLVPVGFASNGGGLVILLYACRAWEGQPAALEGGDIGWFALVDVAGLAMPPLDYPLAEALLRAAPRVCGEAGHPCAR
ncbi:MAG TPA: (deoxy)nucleoside triphosphate pyrophosphohydrolase [Novosphingobium sp.]|nr:(deoxy)nucleoside triphosphate pyrophosphohydrolase [Novosphingobium sp.]